MNAIGSPWDNLAGRGNKTDADSTPPGDTITQEKERKREGRGESEEKERRERRERGEEK